MPASTRLSLALSIYLLFGSASVHAETLNDDGIRTFYAGADAALLDKPASFLRIIQHRLDSAFKLKLTLGTIVESGPPQVLQKILSKDDLTDYIVKSSYYAVVKSMRRDIASISYYQSNSLAYVTYTLSLFGDLRLNAGTGKAFTTINFSTTASCVDTLKQQEKLIIVLRSECTAQELIVNEN